MPDASHAWRQSFNAATTTILARHFAAAERRVNVVRVGVIGVLAICAALYAPHLTPQLTVVNALVLAPVLAWAVWQHVVVHARRPAGDVLSVANIVFDISAVSLLLLGYGVFGEANLAVKSPIFSLYFVVLATRPFTGSPWRAAFAAVLAAVEYALVVTWLIAGGKLALLASPMVTAGGSGTSLLDEASKVVMLLVAGVVATYATAWIGTALRDGVSARRNADARFRAMFDQTGVGVTLLDESATILEANEAMGELLGVDARELIGRQAHAFSPAEDADTCQALVREVSSGMRETGATELRYLRSDGEVAWGSLTVSRAEGAQDVKVIAVVQDVTPRKALEKELLRQAFYDQLTGLANRALFRDRVQHALQRSSRERESVAVMLLDLDNFKSVNDTLGHAAGDALLTVVATRLLNATRGCDTVARLGGDEFAVLLENVRGDEDAAIVAGRIEQALMSPVELPTGVTVRVSASLGIARARPEDGVEELLRNADVSMYAAKSGQRGGHVFFDPSMHAALVDRVAMETDLRHALEHGELWLAYQPIVALDTRELLGIEALVRWNHPTRGLIPPADFIPLAEETGLVVPLGRWVLREACARTAEWNATRNGARPISVTVNLAAQQLESSTLHDDVLAALNAAALSPSQLVLEITENALMHRTEVTLARLHALKALGVRLAIDDFGTGYSSLSYLQQFPVDILKIDRSFTDGLLRGANDDALARTIIALGDLLTLRTIAEGVEDTRQHERLRALGCDYGQGNLFSRPLSATDISKLFADGSLRVTGEQPIVASGGAPAL